MVDIFNYKLPVAGRVRRVVNFVQSNTFFFAFGQSSSWDSSWGQGISDTNPPIVTDQIQVPQPFIYKKAYVSMPAVEIEYPTIPSSVLLQPVVNNKKWSVINLEKTSIEVLNKIDPQHVYLSAELTEAEFLSSSFRAVGVYSSLVLNDGVNSQKVSYLPSEVSDPGALNWLSFSTPVLKQTNKTLHFEVVFNI